MDTIGFYKSHLAEGLHSPIFVDGKMMVLGYSHGRNPNFSVQKKQIFSSEKLAGLNITAQCSYLTPYVLLEKTSNTSLELSVLRVSTINWYGRNDAQRGLCFCSNDWSKLKALRKSLATDGFLESLIWWSTNSTVKIYWKGTCKSSKAWPTSNRTIEVYGGKEAQYIQVPDVVPGQIYRNPYKKAGRGPRSAATAENTAYPDFFEMTSYIEIPDVARAWHKIKENTQKYVRTFTEATEFRYWFFAAVPYAGYDLRHEETAYSTLYYYPFDVVYYDDVGNEQWNQHISELYPGKTFEISIKWRSSGEEQTIILPNEEVVGKRIVLTNPSKLTNMKAEQADGLLKAELLNLFYIERANNYLTSTGRFLYTANGKLFFEAYPVWNALNLYDQNFVNSTKLLTGQTDLPETVWVRCATNAGVNNEPVLQSPLRQPDLNVGRSIDQDRHGAIFDYALIDENGREYWRYPTNWYLGDYGIDVTFNSEFGTYTTSEPVADTDTDRKKALPWLAVAAMLLQMKN